ncbi:MAG: sodium:solute symporter family protein, partial [Pseudomonadota bacterium]
MRGVGIVFSRFLEVDINTGVIIGMCIVFIYAGLGGMKGITWTQVAQYCTLITAYLIPAWAISYKVTGVPIPQIGFGSTIAVGPDAGKYLLDTLNVIATDFGFIEYTKAFASTNVNMLNVFCIMFALMVGTAGLPHVIIRFFTVPKVRDARLSAGWALFFIALLYTTAPAVAAFARYNMVETLNDKPYANVPAWFLNWQKPGLTAWVDKNGDGKIQYRPGAPFVGRPSWKSKDGKQELGKFGEPLLANKPTDNKNELYIDRDIMVLASPEIGGLPAWVVGLVAAGGLAAALSTAAGLLLAVGSAVSHDLYYRVVNKQATEKQRLLVARIMIGVAIACAGWFGIYPPAFVAQVVAFAFGLAAASLFPIILLGIFSTRVTREAAICGMIAGIVFTAIYIINARFMGGANWFLGITPEGIGTVGMVLNFLVTGIVTQFTKAPPKEIQELVEMVRIPKGAGAAVDH